MPTSNIINRGTWWSSAAPLISLTQPLPAQCTTFSGYFFQRPHAMPCYQASSSEYLALVLTSSYHNSIWIAVGPRKVAWDGTISATNDEDFSVLGISDRPSVSYERRHLGRSNGILSLLWSLIKTDKIIGHQEMGGGSVALGGQFIWTPTFESGETSHLPVDYQFSDPFK